MIKLDAASLAGNLRRKWDAYCQSFLVLRRRKRNWTNTERIVQAIFKSDPKVWGKHNPGFYVDVGCWDPVRENTTYALYRRGWRGVNIDIDQAKIDVFNIRRRHDVNIASAISNHIGTARYYQQGTRSSLNSLEEVPISQRQKWKEIEVSTNTLTNILDSTRYKNCQIDFLSVDVEGHEVPVLKSLDYERYQPRVICAETWHTHIQAVLQSKLYKLLTSRGYVLTNWIGLNLIFQHEIYGWIRDPTPR